MKEIKVGEVYREIESGLTFTVTGFENSHTLGPTILLRTQTGTEDWADYSEWQQDIFDRLLIRID